MAKSRNIRADSAAAVGRAGSRVPGPAVKSAGAWGVPGRIGPNEKRPYRPGKTQHERRR